MRRVFSLLAAIVSAGTVGFSSGEKYFLWVKKANSNYDTGAWTESLVCVCSNESPVTKMAQAIGTDCVVVTGVE